MLGRIKKILILSFSLLMFGCSGDNDSSAPSKPNPEESKLEIQSLSLTPAQTMIPAGFSQEYRLDALLSNGQVVDITNDAAVTWKSSDATIAMPQTKDGVMHVEGLMPGTVTISASIIAHGSTFSAKADLEVTDALMTALQVTPVQHMLPAGLEQQYTAVVTMSDGHSYDVTNNIITTWSSSETTVVTISNDVATKGLARGISPGTSTIRATATINGVTLTASAQLDVSNAIMTALQVTPAMTVTAAGFEQQFTAIITMSDGHTYDVTDEAAIHWLSSNSDVVSISNEHADKGLAKGLKPGSSTITATVTANGVTFNADAHLEVTDAIAVKLKVTPSKTSIAAGLEQQFSAKMIMSDSNEHDVTDAVSWHSSDTTVATVSNNNVDKGRVTAIKPGVTTITANVTSNGVTFNSVANVDVTDAVITAINITPNNVSIAKGLKQRFAATAILSDGSRHDITDEAHWNSDDISIASRSEQGLFKGVGVGKTVISATLFANNRNASNVTGSAPIEITDAIITSLTVNPDPMSDTYIVKTHGKQYSATAEYSDGTIVDVTNQASWESSDTNIATIDMNGFATGVALGEAIIKVQIDGFEERPKIIVTTLELCGGVVNDTHPSNRLGACIKVLDDSSTGALYTTAPSSAVMRLLGYRQDNSSSNSGFTYATLYTYWGDVATFRLDGQDWIDDSSNINFGLNGQASRFCTDLSNIGFNGRSNWKLATKDDLDKLYTNKGTIYSDRFGLIKTPYWGISHIPGFPDQAYWSFINGVMVGIEFSSQKISAMCVSK